MGGLGRCGGEAHQRTSLVMDQAVADLELDRRDAEDDHEQQPGHRGRQPEVELPERLLEQVDPEEQRGVRRTAGAVAEEQQVRLVEDLQRRDGVDDGQEEQRRRDQRNGDREELTDPAGSVGLGRLVELTRHVLQRREQDHHRAGDRPQAHDHDGRLDPVRVGQPLRAGNAEQPEELVDRAGIAVEQQQEDRGGRHHRGHLGQEEDGPEHARTPAYGGQQRGQGQRDDHLQRDRQQGVEEGVAQRGQHLRVLEQQLVVRQADRRALVGGQVVVGERQPQAPDHRDHREDGEPDDPGRDEQQSGDRLAPVVLLALPAPPPPGRRRLDLGFGLGTASMVTTVTPSLSPARPTAYPPWTGPRPAAPRPGRPPAPLPATSPGEGDRDGVVEVLVDQLTDGRGAAADIARQDLVVGLDDLVEVVVAAGLDELAADGLVARRGRGEQTGVDAVLLLHRLGARLAGGDPGRLGGGVDRPGTGRRLVLARRGHGEGGAAGHGDRLTLQRLDRHGGQGDVVLGVGQHVDVPLLRTSGRRPGP